jgi:hypothetical protein
MWTLTAAIRIFESLGEYLGPDRNPTEAQLEDFAQVLFDNTARPMREHEATDLESYMAEFTGSNLRWESIAMLFTTRELFSTVSDFSTLDSGSNGAWQRHVLPFLRICLEMVENFPANLLVLHITHRLAIMASMAYGDAS